MTMICTMITCWCVVFFFFNDTATTEIYTLSLHDALPISVVAHHRGHLRYAGRIGGEAGVQPLLRRAAVQGLGQHGDRKSTRLNSSHANISYAVFCLKKKKKHISL